jgi:hypothetical protein
VCRLANRHTAARRSPGPTLRCAATFTIVIDTDEAGSFPMLLCDEDALPGGDTRWRLVAQTDDYAEAVGVVDLLHRRCFSTRPTAASSVPRTGG